MNEGLIPGRYAKALYEVAVKRGDDKSLYELMHRLTDAFMAEPTLQQALSNPYVGAADKRKLITTAAGAGAQDATWNDFLTLLTDNKRLDCVREIAMAYRRIYRKAHNIYLVEVVSAAPLDKAEESRLKSLISSHLKGGTMEYTSKVDPDLIGGFVVNIDSERLDASVKNELKQLRFNLLRN